MKETRQFIWTYAKIIFALFILGVAINMFLGPHHIAAGGVSGLGILLEAAFGFDRAIVILVLNIVMLVLALLFLGKKPFFKVLFGSLVVMTYIETGINRKKSVMVMSEHSLEDIRLRLSAEIGRGLTLLEAKGGYNRKSKEVLLIVVTDHEFSRMKPLIEEIDPSAFVIVNSVAEVMGRGFTYHPIE